MERSLKGLRHESFGPPYFMAYRLVDQTRWEWVASLGSILRREHESFQSLYVEARFGSTELDNTDLAFQGWQATVGADPQALRQALWRLTDDAYKGAISGYLEKKAKRAVEYVEEPLADFTQEPPAVLVLDRTPAAFDLARAEKLAKDVSLSLKPYPKIYDSQVSVRLRSPWRYLVTSEGTFLSTPAESVPNALSFWASTRAEDGMKMGVFKTWTMRDLSELPPERELKGEIKALAEKLLELRRAPVQEPMAAPAILDPEFTGVLFHEALGHKLEGQRQRDPQQSQVFKDSVGKRIIPEFLSLWDDPTLESFEGRPLPGFYQYDSEGVAARSVALVERGVLRNFLMSRWPAKGFKRSNGHGRSDFHKRPTGRMANLIVRAEGVRSPEALKAELLALIRKSGKPYGFWLVGSSGGENPNSRQAAQTLEVRPQFVYRVDGKTGEMTLVRGVSLVGTPLVILNRITAAGNDPRLSSGYFCGAESGSIPVSQIAPSVLVSEVELQRIPEDRSRPPLLPSPLHD
ncbi:MAG: TldD/PmbA family protein [Elusimicrobia bacterium]|nr:TldD/PmbA family protein [Elusimicrobiota bacterium]